MIWSCNVGEWEGPPLGSCSLSIFFKPCYDMYSLGLICCHGSMTLDTDDGKIDSKEEIFEIQERFSDVGWPEQSSWANAVSLAMP